ncbi:hypothetical protein, partial [Klebsiella pneumoniae]|uniref:hypothetical protein n=1 Tax=Klebsiella pneumoniae TaxID=573 RepID=UPI00273076CC
QIYLNPQNPISSSTINDILLIQKHDKQGIYILNKSQNTQKIKKNNKDTYQTSTKIPNQNPYTLKQYKLGGKTTK